MRTLRGIFWAYGSYVGGRVLVLISVAILARLLTPSEFGLVGFALTITALLDTISGFGVGQALVVAEEDERFEERATTAFTLSVLVGLALTVLTIAVSPFAADFFREPDLQPLLAVLGLNFLLRGAGSTHFAIAQKQIDFRTRTAAELADVVVRGGAGVVLALAGAGAWSLVLGYLLGTAAMTVILWILVPFRPKLQRKLLHARGLVRFGGGLAILDVLSAITSNIDYLLVGRVLGATDHRPLPAGLPPARVADHESLDGRRDGAVSRVRRRPARPDHRRVPDVVPIHAHGDGASDGGVDRPGKAADARCVRRPVAGLDPGDAGALAVRLCGHDRNPGRDRL